MLRGINKLQMMISTAVLFPDVFVWAVKFLQNVVQKCMIEIPVIPSCSLTHINLLHRQAMIASTNKQQEKEQVPDCLTHGDMVHCSTPDLSHPISLLPVTTVLTLSSFQRDSR